MLHRRDSMLRLGTLGLGALTLPQMLAPRVTVSPAQAAPDASLSHAGKAKSAILVYLWGGPPQQDMWDLKPEAPEGIRSRFEPIDTNVPGIQISDQLSRVALHADKLAIVRAMTHPSNTHEVGVYHTLAGKVNNTLSVPRNRRSRSDFPNVAGIVSHFTPPGAMPASVTVPRPIGHDGVVYTGTHAGFLGPRFDPVELQPPAEVDEEAPHNFDLPDGVDAARLRTRVSLLERIERTQRHLEAGGASFSLDAAREQAYAMVSSPQAKRAFQIDDEDPRTRDRYGRNEWGEALLLSRRLIESGVRLVTMIWYYVCPDGNVANVWDNHGGSASLGRISGYDMLQQIYCLPSLDQGFSALLEDMGNSGLLDETLVAMFGEFGRTPLINKNGGRDHWGACQSAVFAGGGVRGGNIYGASDGHAAYPKSQPVRPEDVLATIYHALGIPPDAEIYDSARRPHRISDGEPILGLF